MSFDFSPEEVRVLGCLIEKRLSTPGSYPLTMNSLVTACNQSSNRDPVVRYDNAIVNSALKSTRQAGYSTFMTRADARVPKFSETTTEKLGLEDREAAVLAELMLRGPQTPGELRQRSTRMHDFGELSEVEEVLQALAERQDPLVVQLPRQPGKREARYAHLLGGEVELPEETGGESLAAAVSGPTLAERVAALEEQLADALERLERLENR